MDRCVVGEKDCLCLERANDREASGESVLPACHQREILRWQMCRILRDEVFAERVMFPQSVAHLHGIGCLDRSLRGCGRK